MIAHIWQFSVECNIQYIQRYSKLTVWEKSNVRILHYRICFSICVHVYINVMLSTRLEMIDFSWRHGSLLSSNSIFVMERRNEKRTVDLWVGAMQNRMDIWIDRYTECELKKVRTKKFSFAKCNEVNAHHELVLSIFFVEQIAWGSKGERE